ncbi:MAG: carboxylesterase family protein [Rhodothermaceae bacterium]|nr:carboxylesterase family protein [Rhodothermaceae bacterium]MXX58841.1 carboxylesterase family protein [Rhodothermaceae bacterium]MYD18360.1 carboxylesterase family protein [Rhodothermaceae bacterium]MYD55727.1 carboxylesterase family protein [Rhodothermaceae bacterium]MYF39528.1 carboxylesterase family protein [Rhodothermaceae bacterium]
MDMDSIKRWLWHLGIGWLVCFPAPTVAQVVELDQGFVRGLSESRVHVYQGIPYAAPPIGHLRWQPPQPLPAWEDTLNADTFSAGCVQDVVGSRPPWTEEFMHQGGVSEDCLYLNVWTQAEYSEQPKPVLVYIHGGAFQEGSGSVAVYDGSRLAQKGLVVVTINYRLGILGFFAHPDLSADSPHQASGNYGLLDQVAALQWVKKNIAAFGGDPENVTVAGQSAGAMSVFLLAASPLAKGLFQRVIAQSGPGGLASFGLSDLRSVAIPLSDAEEAGREYVANHNLLSVQEMRMMTTNELSSLPSVRFFPVIDGVLVTGDVSAIYDRGLQHQVPMMTGFNADEGSAFPGYGRTTLEEYQKSAHERYEDEGDLFLSLYPADSDMAAGIAQKSSLRDLAAVALERLAAVHARSSGEDVYLYYFERAIPWPERPEFGAFHTAEVPYFFGTLDHLDRPLTEVDKLISDTMSDYWVNFATSGSPNGADIPLWPSFREGEVQFLKFGSKVEPITLTENSKSKFFNEYLSRSQ